MTINKMKTILAGALPACPMVAFADHVDVIEFKLKEGCRLGKNMEIVKDVNTRYAKHGYKAEILTPIQSGSLESLYWLGRS